MGEQQHQQQDDAAERPTSELNETQDTATIAAAKTKTFYGVYIPPDVQLQEADNTTKVFDNKSEALKLAKKYKKARFKAFDFAEDAVDFAANGADCPNNNTSTAALETTPSKPAAEAEKHSIFRGPTSQNLVKLRKGIEAGDVDFVRNTIWENPRYLIGVGDTPSILQEGGRYNALHVACKAKNAIMCELLLNTISNIAFVKKLYVDDNNPEDRTKILLDLYLNTPDKAVHETPLHFAVKFGAPKCVEVLVSFPQCDRNLRNKHGNQPKDIICERYDGADAGQFTAQIAELLQDNYYVPVLRSEDNCASPVIGEPFSPTSPPHYESDPLSPRMEIHAYAGPMNKEGADRFRKMWKTPPRVLNFGPNLQSASQIVALKMKDPEKGLERLGNNLARRMDVPWKEYWPFLDSFIDLSSDEGLRLFENYLADKVAAIYGDRSVTPPKQPSPQEQGSQTSPVSLAARCMPRNRAMNSPMWELCRALQACSLDDHSPSQSQQLSNPSSNGLNGHTHNGIAAHELSLNPCLCIDKSLNVFAKRISNDILYLLESDYESCTMIETQIKQLHLLMASYMNDPRFETVDITKVHCRLAYLIKALLIQDVQETSLRLMVKQLDKWLEFSSKHYDCFSSDDEALAAKNMIVASKSQHMICLLKFLRDFVSSDLVYDEPNSEQGYAELWRTAMKPCACRWEAKTKRQNGSKRFLMKHNLASCVFHDLPRKLSFEENNPEAGVIMFAHGDTSSGEEEGDEVFYTPPSSPSLLEDLHSDDDDDMDDEFHETQLPDFEIFIEGDVPTKMDYAAYNALKYAECELSVQKYPNIYRWHHAVGLFSEAERLGWTNSNAGKYNLGSPSVTSTPVAHRSAPVLSPTTKDGGTPPNSWMRITGVNSPRSSVKYQRCNVSFNL